MDVWLLVQLQLEVELEVLLAVMEADVWLLVLEAEVQTAVWLVAVRSRVSSLDLAAGRCSLVLTLL